MSTSKFEGDVQAVAPQPGHLQQACDHGLLQCQQLLAELSLADYADKGAETAAIGAHVRHILERYLSFLAGLAEGCVDYDARDRDRSLEDSPQAATEALVSIRRRIQALQVDSRALQVRESVLSGAPGGVAGSTVERELLALVSHTTHHLAMIAMLARPLGYNFGDDFGKAASTIIYEQHSSA